MIPLVGAAAALVAVERRVREAPPDDSEAPIPYEDFRTEFTFEGVREQLAEEQRRTREQSGGSEYMYVTRSTVLGRMHELKTEAYERYLEDWRERHGEPDDDLPPLPF